MHSHIGCTSPAGRALAAGTTTTVSDDSGTTSIKAGIDHERGDDD
ncbi:MAG: hypothetical protein WBZ54_00235 [Methylocella sp.]